MPTAIEFENVYKTYGRRSRKKTALDDVTFRVETGEFVVLTGHSGAGKTTMIKLLLALEQPDKGVIRVADRDLHRLTRSSIPYLRRNIGVVFQDFRLLPETSPLENVRITLQVLGLGRTEVDMKACNALERVGLDPMRRDPVRCLSGGEQQRVALARALASNPAILLADEPTGNLDPALTAEILSLLGEIRDQGTTIMLATHDPQVMISVNNARQMHLDHGVLTGGIPDEDENENTDGTNGSADSARLRLCHSETLMATPGSDTSTSGTAGVA